MASHAKFAEVASLAGDPARVAMLHALLDGRALTASELACVAGITPQTSSGHLARMVSAGLVAMQKQGRHRYHRLASQAVAQMLEASMLVASDIKPSRQLSVGPRDAALRVARTCYDHLAGHLGVALADALVRAGHAELTADAGIITGAGIAFFHDIGIEVDRLMDGKPRRSKRVLCRPCLDWSERRPHLAGALGTAICRYSLEKGWILRVDGTRAVSITPKGERVFRERFGAKLD
jgi:DNA-binding transcriptional ArsR family regulator